MCDVNKVMFLITHERIGRYLFDTVILVHGYDQIKSTMGICSSHRATAPGEPAPPHYRRFTVTLRHTKLGRTLLDE